MTFVLVHSPLVGPATCAPLADELRSRGRSVVVPSLLGTLAGGPGWARRQVAAVHAAVDADGAAGPYLLAGHSGAGPLLPAIGAALGHVQAYLFVDAAPPRPGQSWFDKAPAPLVKHLTSLATDGWVPPWNEWFGEEEMAAELADPSVRRSVLAELSRLPLAMFTEPAPEVPGWPDALCGYLRLSPGYDRYLAEARSRGWRTASLDAWHLSLCGDPVPVADAMLGLLESAD